MNKIVELPLLEPLYKTYHNGIVTACISTNPSIRNWFLSNTIMLMCNRKFLSGFTTPEVQVEDYTFESPLFETNWIPMRFLKGCTNLTIRNLLDMGYYVYFCCVDDYYVDGKSWHKTRHFCHDGTICGYNQEDKTFCMYAYDKNWIYKKFWTPQKSFNKGREAMFRKRKYGSLCAIKPRQCEVEFSVEEALKGIKKYLNSDLNKYPESGEGVVKGIVVHEYIAKYIDKLIDGSIPYNRIDRRIFRIIWEHKKVMLERILKIEETLQLDSKISEKYSPLVSETDTVRMMYASHYMKRRDSVLPIIKKKLLNIMQEEKLILTELLDKVEKEGK